MPQLDKDEKKELIDYFMKLISERAEALGIGRDAFEGDRQLLEDLFTDSGEMMDMAREFHNKIMNSASHAIEAMLAGKKGGIEEVQQMLILYYRMRDQVIEQLFNVENEFYHFLTQKVLLPSAMNRAKIGIDYGFKHKQNKGKDKDKDIEES